MTELELPTFGICGEPKSSGQKCREPAGKGVEGINYGPCAQHRSEKFELQNNAPQGNTTINKRKIAVIETVLRDGGTKTSAANRAGVALGTLNQWFKLGQEEAEGPPEERSIYYDYYIQVSDAIEDGKDEMLNNLIDAGREDWRMWKWVMEKMYPTEYGDRGSVDTQQHEVTHKVDGEASKKQKDFLQKLAGGGIEPDERETINVESREIIDE